MAVNIPGEYDPTDLVLGHGVTPTVPIRYSGLQALAANQMFLKGKYRPTVAGMVHALSPGASSADSGTQDLFVWKIKTQQDLCPIGAYIRYANNTGGDATITLATSADSDSEVVADGTAGLVTLGPVGIPSSSEHDVYLRIDQPTDMNILSVEVFWWPTDTGADPDPDETVYGFKSWDSGELTSNLALTTENFNRFAKNPAAIFRSYPTSVAYLAAPVTYPNSSYTTTSEAWTQIAAFPLIMRYKDQVRWRALITGRNDAGFRIRTVEDPNIVASFSATWDASLPANPSTSYVFVDERFTLPAGAWTVIVEARSDGTDDFDLWSLTGFVE